MTVMACCTLEGTMQGTSFVCCRRHEMTQTLSLAVQACVTLCLLHHKEEYKVETLYTAALVEQKQI